MHVFFIGYVIDDTENFGENQKLYWRCPIQIHLNYHQGLLSLLEHN